jgi:hypothetical protein
LFHCACVLIEDLDGPNPLLSLAVINFYQIQNRLLDNAIGTAAPIFHNRPVVMLLAVFPSGRAAQKHDPTDFRQNFYAVKRLGLHYTLL